MMDARTTTQMANNEQPPTNRLKVWKPQSKIAAYIKGNVRLEDIVSRDKITKPEHRHNRRAFLPLVNDDDHHHITTGTAANTANSIAFRSRTKTESSLSSISRYPSSTKTSLSLHRGQRLTTDDLMRTIAEKNEYITKLHEQLDTLRSCARVESMAVEGEPIECVLDKMLECLLDMLINLKNFDEHDERMIQFVAAIERERENILSGVTALRESNSHKEEQIRQMRDDQATLNEEMQSLRQDVARLQTANTQQLNAYESATSDVHNCRAKNEKLKKRLREYELKYQKAAVEIETLTALCENVRSRIEADKNAFNELDQRSKQEVDSRIKTIEKMKDVCKNFSREKTKLEKQLAQLQQQYEMEIGSLQNVNAATTSTNNAFKDEIAKLENEIQQQTGRKTALQTENEMLEEKLKETRQVKETISGDVKRLRQEKETLERTLTEWHSKGCGISSETNDELNMTTLAKQEVSWHKLKQYLHKTVLRAGLVQDDDRR